MTRLQVSFTIHVNQYIDLNIYQASYVFFYLNLSGQWLWALQGKYSYVLEENEEVPFHVNDQGGNECHILFVNILLYFGAFI